jgi:SAM-dependent methyltransferase
MNELLFDQPYYLAINEARWPVFEHLLGVARQAGPIDSILDAGCGPGWFAEKMSAAGLKVLGVDARVQLVIEARRRAPKARFEAFDFDRAELDDAPDQQDAVFAFGLLYHLENPLRAIRVMRACARHAVFLETMTIPERTATARLVQENPNETQGFHGLALVMTPTAIVHALFAVGFAHVYVYEGGVAHPDFAQTAERHKRRDIFLATDAPVSDPTLREVERTLLDRYDYSIAPAG